MTVNSDCMRVLGTLLAVDPEDTKVPKFLALGNYAMPIKIIEPQTIAKSNKFQ